MKRPSARKLTKSFPTFTRTACTRGSNVAVGGQSRGFQMQSVYTSESRNFGSGPKRETVKPLPKEESNSPAGGFLEMQRG